MRLNIPKTYENMLKKLNNNGFEAYIVGGCVRDLLLGTVPNDYDITTSATPDQIKSVFCNTVDTGIKHGTVTVIEDGYVCEVTTFRTESDYSDMRRPNSVKFVSDIKLDLSRRDFTVNAICYNPDTGIINLFNSLEDLENKILRTVGNPQERFNEDALRIMRLFRFAATLDFEIEEETYAAAIKLSHLLKNISHERIAAELKKAVLSDNISNFSPLIDCGALEFCGIYKADISKISLLKKNFELRLYSLLKLASRDMDFTLRSLKMSNSVKDYCYGLEFLESTMNNCSKAAVKNILNCSDFSLIRDFIEYKKVIENEDLSDYLHIAQDIIENKEPYKISHLDISGEDLLELGYKGKEVGKILEILRKKVVDDKTLNKKAELIEIVKFMGN